MLAIRFVKHSVTEILDWARAQGAAMFDAILQSVEAAGEAISTVIEWAEAVGDQALELLAEATRRVGNSIEYVLSYVANDALPALGNVIKGALDAGMALVDVMAWALDRSLEVLTQTVQSLLDLGKTIAQLVAATIANPGDALDNLLKALDAVGKTLGQIADDVWTLGEVAWEAFVRSAKAIGRLVVDILRAAWDIVGAALGAAVSILCSMLAGYRAMTPQEVAEARLVFEDALDYDHIFFAVDDITNDIIFGLQDWFRGETASRAFVTNSLVNFDVDDGLSRRTMIHELTHVWQYQQEGSAYLADAVYAQATGDGVGDSGYNYGYREQASPTVTIPKDFAGAEETGPVGDWTGEDGQDDLAGPAATTWAGLNPEMQAQVIMHWYVRKVLESQSDADVAPWQPYVDLVRAA